MKNLSKDKSTFFIDSSNITSYQSGALVIGGIIVKDDHIKKVHDKIKEIKHKYNLKSIFEIKWSKTSSKFILLYDEIFNYIFMNPSIAIHILVAQKSPYMNLNDYLNWYTSMYGVLELHCPFKYDKVIWTKNNKQWDPILNYASKSKDYQFRNAQDSQILQISDFIVGAIASFYNNKIISPGKLLSIQYLERYMKIHNTTIEIFDKSIHSLENYNRYNLLKWGFG